MRAMDEVSQEPARPQGPPSAAMGTDLSNRPARDALVLGIISFLLPPAFAIGLWASLNDMELAAWAVMLYLISLVAAICACRFGVEGRRLAKMGAPGRVPASIGLVLGIGFILVSVLGPIVGFIAFAISAGNDPL